MKRAWIAGATVCALGVTTAAPAATAEPAPVVLPNPQAGPMVPLVAGAAAVIAVLAVMSAAGSSDGQGAPQIQVSSSGDDPDPDRDAPLKDDTTRRPGGGTHTPATGSRAIGPGGAVISVKPPAPADVTDPGYDISKPLPGLAGLTVEQARGYAQRAVNIRRDELGLAPLEFTQLPMTIAQDEAVILGKDVADLGNSAYRAPNTSNWAAIYPELTAAPWWKDSVPPAAVVWRSTHADAPTRLLDIFRGQGAAAMGNDSYTHGGVGVWRNPGTGEWFFVIALLP